MIVTGDPFRRSSLVESVLDRVESLPGVSAAGTIQFLPLGGFTNNGPFHFVGRPEPGDPKSMESDVSTVSRGYFAALGIPVLRGRPFGRQDRMDKIGRASCRDGEEMRGAEVEHTKRGTAAEVWTEQA